MIFLDIHNPLNNILILGPSLSSTDLITARKENKMLSRSAANTQLHEHVCTNRILLWRKKSINCSV